MIFAVSYDNPGDISPGVLGFIVVAALAIVLFFLLRSMNKHLRKVSAARDEGRELGEPPPAEGSAGPAGTSAPAGAVSKRPNGSADG
jgi:HAMP domain-containing protein